MMQGNTVAGAGAKIERPEEHRQPFALAIGPADLKDALLKGWADFDAMPTHLFYLCLTYPIVTLIVARIYAGYEVLPLVFPLLAGYTLIGPLIAVGTYELSRRREAGLRVSRWDALEVVHSPAFGGIVALGLLLMLFYFVWLAAAWVLYAEIIGTLPDSVADFVDTVLTTQAGFALIVVGCGVGFVFAAIVFMLSVVSFPMILDRNVPVAVAVRTSIRAVLANPLTMGIWGLVVAAALLLGALPLFVGLAVVLPVLGHATWHLYRRVVTY